MLRNHHDTDKRKPQICVHVKLPAASLRPWSVARPAVHGSQHRGHSNARHTISHVTIIQQKMSARDTRFHLNTRRNNIRVRVLRLQVRTAQRREECWRRPMHLCLPPQGRNFVLQSAAALEQSLVNRQKPQRCTFTHADTTFGRVEQSIGFPHVLHEHRRSI
jgi:hypothetical protein